jgi:MFS family permease
MGGVFFFTSFYLQNVRGYSALDAGLLTIPFAVGQLILSPRSAGMVRQYGPKAVSATAMIINAAALAGYATLGTHTPIWILGLLFVVQGASMGAAMPAATAAVMDVLPRERAGAGSALTNTARQVAVALSVAVLGSILAEFYASKLHPTLSVLPQGLRATASSSITATQAVAQGLGKQGQFLLAPANDAFVNAMHYTTLVAAAMALLGGLVVLRWMPGKPAAEPAQAPQPQPAQAETVS